MVPAGEPRNPSRQSKHKTPEPRILSIRGSRSVETDRHSQSAGAAEATQSQPSQVSLNKGQITFQSETMKTLIQQAKRFARSSASVLITGESGTGKELFSRLIHEESQRSNQRYVTVNCAAMPEMLVESEFFGHERGAFTGAFQQRIGHFQQAHLGTILLDEVSEIPPSIQAKLLRTIEEQEIQRIGSSQSERIDVRIVATSNRNLKQETMDGTFRLDLYHRLNVLQLEIPPLRERTEDIPSLVNHFLNLFRFENGHQIQTVSAAAMETLCRYSWPGNIRELRNVVHRASVICESEQITVDSLPALIEEPNPANPAGRTLADVEKQMIYRSLKKFGGNKAMAAEELGITSRTINNKLKLYQEQSREAA